MTTNPDKGYLPERPSALPRQRQGILDEEWIHLATAEATHTAPGDVPVGTVVVDAEGRVVDRDSNRREADDNPLTHAKVIALREAIRAAGDS